MGLILRYSVIDIHHVILSISCIITNYCNLQTGHPDIHESNFNPKLFQATTYTPLDKINGPICIAYWPNHYYSTYSTITKARHIIAYISLDHILMKPLNIQK